ncbi:MAG: hypothetical protein I3J02_05320 [Prevotella sp.]|nr:hypothetical protein [Prevotella sp.]
MGYLSTWTIVLCALFFIVLGLMWILGYDFIKKHSPENLPKFYLLMSVVRFLAVLTLAGGYILLVSNSQAQSESFALMVCVMYVVMMAVTLKIKH